jgi:hypothetical protein
MLNIIDGGVSAFQSRASSVCHRELLLNSRHSTEHFSEFQPKCCNNLSRVIVSAFMRRHFVFFIIAVFVIV